MTLTPAQWCWDSLLSYKLAKSNSEPQQEWASSLLDANSITSITASELDKRMAELEALKKKLGKKNKVKVNRFLTADQSGIFDPASTLKDHRWALHSRSAVQGHAASVRSLSPCSQEPAPLSTVATTHMVLRRTRQTSQPSQPARCSLEQSGPTPKTNLQQSIKGLKSSMRRKECQNDHLADELEISMEALEDVRALYHNTCQELHQLRQQHQSALYQHSAMTQQIKCSQDAARQIQSQLARQQGKVANLRLELADLRQNEVCSHPQHHMLAAKNIIRASEPHNTLTATFSP